MNRLQALEAVAEAARQLRDWETDHSQSMADRMSLWHALDDALIALDALPADPAPARGEVVVWCNSNGRLEFSIAGSFEDSAASEAGERLGTTHFPLTVEAPR